VEKESLPEAAVVSLIQEINAHNSVDYLRQIFVDVAEDLQEQTNSRAEEQAKLTKALESDLPPNTVTERSIRILRACLVSQPIQQQETVTDERCSSERNPAFWQHLMSLTLLIRRGLLRSA
jgi:hypothetical protein